MPPREGFRAALVIGQIALALVLLTGAGLMAKSFLRLRAVDPGFDTDNVVRLSVELPQSSYSSAQRLHAFHQELLARLSEIPHVAAAGSVNWLPLDDMYISGDFSIDGRAENPRFNVDKPAVSPGYFRTMGIRLLRGREFSASDTASAPPVVIVSRTVANAIDSVGRRARKAGQRVDIGEPGGWHTIVGVVEDVKQLNP